MPVKIYIATTVQLSTLQLGAKQLVAKQTITLGDRFSELEKYI
jgi:hypothetical protein